MRNGLQKMMKNEKHVVLGDWYNHYVRKHHEYNLQIRHCNHCQRHNQNHHQQNTTIVQQSDYNKILNEIQIQKPKLTDENHNDCFIEAHNKELEEQQSANENIILIRKERNTIVK
jgi:hypothetical protein